MRHLVSWLFSERERSRAAVNSAVKQGRGQWPHRRKPRTIDLGGVPEWLKGAVLKTVVRFGVPWVRIPPPSAKNPPAAGSLAEIVVAPHAGFAAVGADLAPRLVRREVEMHLTGAFACLGWPSRRVVTATPVDGSFEQPTEEDDRNREDESGRQREAVAALRVFDRESRRVRRQAIRSCREQSLCSSSRTTSDASPLSRLDASE